MAWALALIYLIWGMNWVVMKTANSFFPPIQFVTYRFLLGAAVLLLVSLLCRVPLPERRYWPWIFLTGVLQMGLNNVAAQSSMMELGAGLAAVLNYSMPVWLAVMAHFALGERLTVRRGIGIALAMAGLVVLVGAPGGGALVPVGIGLLSAIFWGLASLVFKLRLATATNLLQVATWQMVSSAAMLVLYTTLVPQGEVHWALTGVLALVYNGVLASALAFFLWCYILQHMEAGKAGTAVLGVPVVGVLGGALVRGEPLTAGILLGMALILAGIAVVVKAPQKEARSDRGQRGS